MAHVQLDVFSNELATGTSVEIVYPADDKGGKRGGTSKRDKQPPAVLYLLHGLSDDHTTWMRNTSIERYATQYNLAVVMPGVARSFYRDMASGPAYWSYVSEELPAIVSRTFRVDSSRERTFVAGLSMGGYGALLHGFTHPDRYAAAASFSGVVDMVRRFDEFRASSDPKSNDLTLVFGDEIPHDGDLFALSGSLESRSTPALFVTCGTDDVLLADNEALHGHLTKLGIEHEYHTEPGGHEWALWDRHVDRFLRFLERRGFLRA